MLGVLAVAGCAQFRPPAEGAGDGAAAAAPSRCAAPIAARFTYADELGSSVEGADGALRVRGTLAAGGAVYAGVGFTFTEPKGPFDASRFDGLAFTARRGAAGTPHVRIKVPDASTDPAGGVCTECFNDFGLAFQVDEAWTRYEVRFAQLVQETGWGAPRPDAIDAARLYGVQWQATTPGAAIDLEIGEVTFLGCDGAP